MGVRNRLRIMAVIPRCFGSLGLVSKRELVNWLNRSLAEAVCDYYSKESNKVGELRFGRI